MRPAVGMLAVLLGGLSLAFANPPDTPAAPESNSTAVQSGNAQDTKSQNSAAHTVPASATAAAAQAPAAAPAKPAARTSDERMMERQLRLQGYKLSMVRGEEKYCRREIPIGSHLATVLHCVTVAEAEVMAKEGRETTERIQRNSVGCLTPGQGGCGK